MADSKLIIKDKGWKKLKKTMGIGTANNKSAMYTTVGVHDPTIASYAALSEFGGVGVGGNDIPARPAMALAFSANFLVYMEEMGSIITQALKGVPPEVTLNKVGKRASSDIRKMLDISPIWAKELAKMTLAIRRGKGVFSEQPLVDSGAYYESIKHVVHRGKHKGK